jgi:hypothetical protein
MSDQPLEAPSATSDEEGGREQAKDLPRSQRNFLKRLKDRFDDSTKQYGVDAYEGYYRTLQQGEAQRKRELREPMAAFVYIPAQVGKDPSWHVTGYQSMSPEGKELIENGIAQLIQAGAVIHEMAEVSTANLERQHCSSWCDGTNAACPSHFQWRQHVEHAC